MCVCCAGEPVADPQRRRNIGVGLVVAQAVGLILGRRGGSFAKSVLHLRD